MKGSRAHHDPASREEAPPAERLLVALGVAPTFVEAVLGDLAEEHAMRMERDGPGAARWWYAMEALRSAPYLVRNVVSRLDARRRLLLFAALTGMAVAIWLILHWRLAESPRPARLVAGTRDTVVVNHVQPVSFPMRVLDSAGRQLPDTAVRYTQLSGAPIDLSARGIVTCMQRSDATVRASLGSLVTDLTLLCRPVDDVRAIVWNDFLLGEAARELPIEFTGTDGEPVTLLSAQVSVRDSTVATLHGLSIQPLRAGRTFITVKVGNRGTGAAIRVFAPVSTLEGLDPVRRPEQRLVAAPVHLAPDDVVRWTLPVGLFNLVLLPEREQPAKEGAIMPAFRVDGPVMCLPAPGPRVYNSHCLVRGPGATVTLSHPGIVTVPVSGSLALDWTALR